MQDGHGTPRNNDICGPVADPCPFGLPDMLTVAHLLCLEHSFMVHTPPIR